MALARRKFVLWLSLILLAVVGLLAIGGQSAQAAVTLPTGVGYINTDSDVFKLGNLPQIRPEGTTVSGAALATTPKLVSVAANNLSDTNRITPETTEIYLIFSGTASISNTSSAQITSFRPVIMNAAGKRPATETSSNLASSGTKTIKFSDTTLLKIDVDFSNIEAFRLLMPLYFGYEYQTSNGSATNTYSLAQTLVSQNTIDIWKSTLSITSTYVGSGGGNVSFIKSTDTEITGKGGYPGLKVWAPLTDADGKLTLYTSTIAADGTFKITLPKMLGELTPAKGLGVVEGNNMGDSLGASASIKTVLAITAETPDLDIYPDGVADNIAGKSDSQILQWIIQEAGVKVSNLGVLLNNDDLTFTSSVSDLANKISALGDGTNLSLVINATNSAGISTNGGVTITITKHDGTLSFGTINDLDFGSQVIPAQTTMFSPVDPGVTIDDTRAAGSAWYVTANASPLTDGNGHAVSGGLVYVGTNGTKQPMTNQAVQVASGTRTKGVNSVNAASGWSKSDSQKQTGIYLDANANTYTGEQSTNYKGTVTWTLSNTP